MEFECLDTRFSTTQRLFRQVPKLESAGLFERLITYPNADLQGGLRTKGFFKQSSADCPLVSVIMATLNSQEFLEETLQSIFEQTYPNLELLIIDGASSDGTLQILQRHADKIDYFMSLKDRGIAQAFNRGVCLAFGDYINFQGDGDGFVAPNALKEVMAGVQGEMLVSARVVRVDEQGKVLYTSENLHGFNKSVLRWHMIHHQGLLTHKDYFNTYGLFDEDLIFSMDYEHLLRAYHNFPSFLAKENVLAQWRDDGLGTHKELEIFKEWAHIKRKNKIAPPLVLKAIEGWILAKFYIKKVLGWRGKH
ncbi:glycosyltransferase family 2 protein [Helicobacter labacensis]|uniref:glycosyltransferase family 2 protein n=1 Tax=Helicobacter labacensis TaxID=2316079 RepID=UPI000EB473BD|nr:glycosyltransferase family 2 protein [Helicobacter labacensis]